MWYFFLCFCCDWSLFLCRFYLLSSKLEVNNHTFCAFTFHFEWNLGRFRLQMQNKTVSWYWHEQISSDLDHVWAQCERIYSHSLFNVVLYGDDVMKMQCPGPTLMNSVVFGLWSSMIWTGWKDLLGFNAFLHRSDLTSEEAPPDAFKQQLNENSSTQSQKRHRAINDVTKL